MCLHDCNTYVMYTKYILFFNFQPTEAYPILKYNSEKHGVRGYLSNNRNIDFKSGAISILSGRKENWLKFSDFGGKFETNSLLNTTRNLWILGKSDFTSSFLLSKKQ